MAYKGLQNNTPYKAELALIADENCRDVMLLLTKATYDIAENGVLSLAEEQAEICFEGEYFGEPGVSSLKIAPEASFTKLASDVVLIGHAHAPNGKPVTELDAGIKVGPVQTHVKVFGDRIWQKRVTANITNWFKTAPKPFSKMPLTYERSFGGQDLTPDDEKHYAYEPRNLVGTGVIAKNSKHEEVPLPNLEDPRQLIQSPADRPQPMGFGFISPDWQPRLGFAGTYDATWEKTRMPLLPTDFKREFFNAAHPALKAPGFLRGNEQVLLVNLTPKGRLVFNLPGQKPVVRVQFQYKETLELNVDLDTVIVDTDEMKLILLWRATLDVFNRIYQIEKILVDESVQEYKVSANYNTTTVRV